MDEIRGEIADTLKATDAEVDKLFDDAAKTDWARCKSLYESVGQTYVSYRDNQVLQQPVSAIKEQTETEFRNITGTLGVATANRGVSPLPKSNIVTAPPLAIVTSNIVRRKCYCLFICNSVTYAKMYV